GARPPGAAGGAAPGQVDARARHVRGRARDAQLQLRGRPQAAAGGHALRAAGRAAGTGAPGPVPPGDGARGPRGAGARGGTDPVSLPRAGQGERPTQAKPATPAGREEKGRAAMSGTHATGPGLWLALAGLASPLVLAAAVLVTAARRPEYSHLRQTI